jgi:ectoine hydroxylase-related dioxygenase (phytanoyl-CoA dioxygenase family)
MKYTLNDKTFDVAIQQEVVTDDCVDFGHKDIIDSSLPWYARGFKAAKLPKELMTAIRSATSDYIIKSVQSALGIKITSVEAYHQFVQNNGEHAKVLATIGKVIKPEKLGIDAHSVAAIVKSKCGISADLDWKDVCDIRVFRPYNGKTMDNNPLHRDTWLEVLNNCVNIYIPIAGNTRKSSISLVPESHLWSRADVVRTASNARINGIQYGLPSVTQIQRDYKVIRPVLKKDEILIFSSNTIHGGSVNLNKDKTRVSIEMRFWIK